MKNSKLFATLLISTGLLLGCSNSVETTIINKSTTKPVSTKSVITKPITTNPIITKPVSTKSVVNNNTTTKTISTKPAITTKIEITKDELIKNILNGKYGNGEERKRIVENLGFNYSEIQKIIDEMSTKTVAKESTNEESTKKTNESIEYKPNSVYWNGYRITYYNNFNGGTIKELQSLIDDNLAVMAGVKFSSTDGISNYLVGHGHTAFKNFRNNGFGKGSTFIITDSKGRVSTYKVIDYVRADSKLGEKILFSNGIKVTDYLWEQLDTEEIGIQYCSVYGASKTEFYRAKKIK